MLAAIATAHAAPADARAAAVILLKNMVRVRWKPRGGRGAVVADGEKAALRELLAGGVAMEEPEAKVASQVLFVLPSLATVCTNYNRTHRVRCQELTAYPNGVE